MLDYLLDAFSGPGAGFMYAITSLLAFSLAVTLERGWLLLSAWRPNAAALEAALSGDDPSAVAEAASGTPLGEVLAAGAAESDPDTAWEAMGAAAARAEARFRRRVGSLGVISNLATMLGLLGTVYGLILAFEALGDASAGERAARLSEGISTAMATTAYGLVVGIPSLALHAWLESAVRERLTEIEDAGGRLVLMLRRRASGG